MIDHKIFLGKCASVRVPKKAPQVNDTTLIQVGRLVDQGSRLTGYMAMRGFCLSD